MAQLGSAPALGAGGRGFKSRHPDSRKGLLSRPFLRFLELFLPWRCARNIGFVRSAAWHNGGVSERFESSLRAAGEPCTPISRRVCG